LEDRIWKKYGGSTSIFLKLQEMLSAHKDLARKLEQMEKKYDAQFKIVFDEIRWLMTLPAVKKRRIGFGRENVDDGFYRLKLIVLIGVE
jgi:hypothetical protein